MRRRHQLSRRDQPLALACARCGRNEQRNELPALGDLDRLSGFDAAKVPGGMLTQLTNSDALHADKVAHRVLLACLVLVIDATLNVAMAHTNAELVVALFDAFAAGDLVAIEAALAPSVTSHTPGRNALAGTARGRDAVLGQLRRSAELSNGTYRVVVEDVMASDRHAAVLYRATGTRAGRRLDLRHLALYAIERARITEVWFTPMDQAVFDRFWA